MVFASLVFLFLFLPLNLVLYYLYDNRTYRNILLVAFSFFFYSWGEPVWIMVMIFSASVDFVNAILIERYRGTAWAKFFLVVSIIINLSLLGLFKYSAFLYENINALFGLHLELPTFALPIGISFYTFQTISYAIDVYRNEVKAQRNYLKYFLFVSLYHQLVAGPIVRYVHIANEIETRVTDVRDISRGVNRFCIGLFKKVFIANIAGELVNQYLTADLSTVSVGAAWFGLLMFAIQIYFDFSGYSDMAIGLGCMFGFHYHENFNYPYTATSATDFWRRWHISLGSFFRDYLYIPLGGNKRNPYLNLFVVWFLTGLWHGASWNFILWGLYFGLLIALERLFLKRFFDAIPKVFSHVYLLFMALLGWGIFYFTDIDKLGQFYNVLFGLAGNPVWDFELGLNIQGHILWLTGALLLCMPVYPHVQAWIESKLKPSSMETAKVVYIGVNVILLLICVALLVGKSYNPFLYFRF